MPSPTVPAAPAQLSLFDLIDSVFPGRQRPAAPAPKPTPAPTPTPTPFTPTAAPAVPRPAGPPPAVGLAPVQHRHPQADHEIDLGAARVAYQLRRARRRSIGFVVGPDGLSVSAPRWVGLGEIEKALQQKAAWILRKLGEQRERQQRQGAARIDWAEGAELPYLGAPLRLHLDPASTGAQLRPAVAGGGCELVLGLPAGAAASRIRDAVQSWLQHQALALFEARCAHYAPQVGVKVSRLRLSAAQTRWGSASVDGSIRLNWRLIHFSLPVIDYVVVHELAHLREMNHSPAFWAVVRAVMPDMAAHRAALRHPVLPMFDDEPGVPALG